MTKPRKRKPKPRPSDRDLDAVVGSTLAFLAGVALGRAAPPDAGAACAACGHARRDHCGCGKTCCWTGPEQVMPDGRHERALCGCVGFAAEAGAGAPQAFCGDGPLGALLDALGLRRRP